MFVAALGVPRDVIDLCHRNQRHRRQHVREGASRGRRRRGGVRPRRRPGHRGRWAHRAGGHDAARPADRRRRRRPGAGRRRGRHLRRARARGRARASVPTACGSARGSSRRPRRARRPATRTRCCARGGRHGDQPRVQRQAHARRAQRHDEALRAAPRGAASRSRSSSSSRRREGSCTCRKVTSAEGVDPDRECYPAGQGVGAIEELVPAGELVRRFVEEAETALRTRGGRARDAANGSCPPSPRRGRSRTSS